MDTAHRRKIAKALTGNTNRQGIPQSAKAKARISSATTGQKTTWTAQDLEGQETTKCECPCKALMPKWTNTRPPKIRRFIKGHHTRLNPKKGYKLNEWEIGDPIDGKSKPCECGHCDIMIPALTKAGKPRRFAKGHQHLGHKRRRGWMIGDPIIGPAQYCECNCGHLMPAKRSDGRPKRFIHGHQMRGRKRPDFSAYVRKHGSSYKRRTGKDHWNWKGGVTQEHRALRLTPEYKAWRLAVYQRDCWTCQFCGKKPKRIVAHHWLGFLEWPEHAYDVSNGVTLCRPCHAKLHPVGHRTRFQKQPVVGLPYGSTLLTNYFK